MIVEQAREIARRWVAEEGGSTPGYAGAYLSGSVLWARADEDLEPSSDVDLTIALADIDEPPVKRGKFPYRAPGSEAALLEVSYARLADLGSPEQVLRDYHRAGTFHLPCVLDDPTGQLDAVRAYVSERFADPANVLQRCDDALDRVRGWLGGMAESMTFPDQVQAWAFGTGVTTHALLVAGLRNPTVRRRYEAVRGLLADHDRLDYHEKLLALLGCDRLTASDVGRHLDALEPVFDRAASVSAPAYRFSSDIAADARPISIGGTRSLIARGLHREAVFWLLATNCRCLTKLELAGVDPEPYAGPLRALLDDLGAATFADRARRAAGTLAELPNLRRVAEALVP